MTNAKSIFRTHNTGDLIQVCFMTIVIWSRSEDELKV